MEFKNFEIKAIEGDDDNIISGYGAFFNNVDQHGDIIVPGAFNFSEGKKIRMLFNHSSDKVIGTWTSFAEDEKGLKITGKFANTPRAQEIKELVKSGAIDSMSIGYRTLDSEQDAQGNRILKSIDLWEVSIVTFPSNSLATIDAVKAANLSKRDLEEKLRDSGFSSSVAKKLISGGYDALQSSRDVEDVEAKEIEQFNELKELLTSRVQIFK